MYTQLVFDFSTETIVELSKVSMLCPTEFYKLAESLFQTGIVHGTKRFNPNEIITCNSKFTVLAYSWLEDSPLSVQILYVWKGN